MDDGYEMKRCPSCHEEKAPGMFSHDKNRWDGRCVYCKECAKLYAKSSRNKKLDHYREMNRRWNDLHPDKIRARNERVSAAIRLSGLTFRQFTALPKAERQAIVTAVMGEANG